MAQPHWQEAERRLRQTREELEANAVNDFRSNDRFGKGMIFYLQQMYIHLLFAETT